MSVLNIGGIIQEELNKPSSSGGGGVPVGTSRPGDFSGSSSGIQAGNAFEQSIIDQMNQNSAAWWDAKTQEERDALHKKNQELAGLLGGDVKYNNGVWTGTTSGSYQPQDQSEYIKEMYEAYLEKQKEALEQAYNNNLSNLQAEQDKLAGNYQSAKNETAAQSALSQQRYNETAAAYGLNTGTAGQAALSYSNQLQSDISALQAAESAANAEIERQRTNLGKEYESALVQAQADNNYELFNALYQEAVRVDQALQQQQQFNAQQSMQQYQMMLDKYYQDKNWGFTQEQWEYQQQQDKYNRDLAAAELLAQSGDYSAYGQLFGWDQNKINQMNNAWKVANTRTYSSGGGGSSSGGSSGTGGGNYDSLFQQAMNSGYPQSYINNNFKKFGFTSKEGLYDEYLGWYSDNNVDMNKVQQIYNTISDSIRLSNADDNDPNFVPKKIMQFSTQNSLGLNRAEVRKLFEMYGYNPDDWVE